MSRSRFESQRVPARQVRKRPLTVQSILAHKHAAEKEWNDWASRNKEARERYEIKFSELAHLPPYEKEKALEQLCLHEEREVFLKAARLWAQMYYWNEVAAYYKADKQIVDVQLNEDPYWWKILMGHNSPIHHEYEPVKAQVFLPSTERRVPSTEYKVPGSSTDGSVAGFKVIDRRGE